MFRRLQDSLNARRAINPLPFEAIAGEALPRLAWKFRDGIKSFPMNGPAGGKRSIR